MGAAGLGLGDRGRDGPGRVPGPRGALLVLRERGLGEPQGLQSRDGAGLPVRAPPLEGGRLRVGGVGAFVRVGAMVFVLGTLRDTGVAGRGWERDGAEGGRWRGAVGRGKAEEEGHEGLAIQREEEGEGEGEGHGGRFSHSTGTARAQRQLLRCLSREHP